MSGQKQRSSPARVAGAKKSRPGGRPSKALSLAIGFHQARQFTRAETLYRRILGSNPGHADCLHNLGILVFQTGRADEAVTLLERAAAAAPASAEIGNTLGNVLGSLKRHDQAIAAFHRAIAANPADAGASNNLGTLYHEQGKLAEAADAFARAVELDPTLASARANLGGTLMAMGRTADAIPHFRAAANLRPEDAGLHRSLGAALNAAGEPASALAAFDRALALAPRMAEAHYGRGEALVGLGRNGDAIEAFDRAIALRPGYAEAFSDLGVALQKMGRTADSVAAYRKAIAANPRLAEAYANLGAALRIAGKLDEAMKCLHKTIALDPEHAAAHATLGGVLRDQGRIDEGVAAYRKALAMNPGLVEPHNSLLMTLHYHPGSSRETIFAEYGRWNARHAAPISRRHQRPPLAIGADGRVRVGMISGDFRRHPVGYMMAGAIKHLDRRTFDVVLYSNSVKSDDVTERLRAAATEWVPVVKLSDDALAERVREDGIHILFDLAGHTRANRLLAFARGPAPIQVLAGGFFDTTGMDVMDYVISDAIETPPGAEAWFTEQVIRMPDGYICYDPPTYAPEVASLPAAASGRLTFGCFNNLAKINDDVVDLWCRVLRRVEDSRLILKTGPLDEPGVRERYHRLFGERGIGAERIDLQGFAPHAELLDTYNAVDIALDPFPYSGGLTTCEALWMGVPVLTLPGPTFAGRHSASHLTNVGRADWIVDSPDAYVEKAEAWADDIDGLAALRAGLRERTRTSPLCDGPRYARNLETALRRMVEDLYQADGGPAAEFIP